MLICAAEQFSVMSVKYAFACCGLLAIYSFYTDYAIFFHCNAYLVEIAHELINRNGRDFIRLNQQLIGEHKYWANDWRAICKLKQFTDKTLWLFPLLSHNVRAKAVVLAHFLETLMAVLLFNGCQFKK